MRRRPGGSPSDFDLTPFKELARNSPCADIRNRLFLIDRELVFWDRAGNCDDAGYAQVLFGKSVEQVLCTLYDSIAGLTGGCDDESYRELFDTLIANLSQPDLGLGSNHTVEEIPL